MFDSEQIHPSHNSVRRVEKELKLTDDNKQEIIDNLVDTVDELRIFSEPIATERTVEDVLLLQQDSRLPTRYNLLNMTQASLHDGSYKTKITLPGHILTLEGTRINGSGVWQMHTGKQEQQPLEHTDAINYLRRLLPAHPHLDALVDSANISDATILDALWNDLSPVADQWQDASYYTTAIDHYTPSLLADETVDNGYVSSVEAVVGYVESKTTTRYTCRVGTQLPIDLSGFNDTTSKKKQEVHEEYRFSAEFSKKTERLNKAMGFLAIESDYLTSGHLHDLVDATARFEDDIPAVYEKATDYIKAKHLDMSSFLDE